MPIRDGEISDIPQLVALNREYFESIGRPPSLDRVARFFTDHFMNDNARVFVSHPRGKPDELNGFITGVLVPQLFHDGPVSHKTSWYARPGARGNGALLLRAYEKWAISQGVKRIHATGREPRTLELLVKRAYEPLELSFVKVLV